MNTTRSRGLELFLKDIDLASFYAAAKARPDIFKIIDRNLKFSENQKNLIISGFQKNLEFEKIEYYANPDLLCDEMNRIFDFFTNGVSIEQIEVLGDFIDHGIDFAVKQELYRIIKEGVTIEQLSLIANHNFSVKAISLIYGAIKDGLTIEQIRMFANDNFNVVQMEKILEGHKKGLPVEKVALYANHDLSDWAMGKILQFMLDGCSKEQIDLCVDIKFSSAQRETIIRGFEAGLTVAQVRFYANYHTPHFDMEYMRKLFREGLNEEEVERKMLITKCNSNQLCYVDSGVELGFSNREIKLFANPRLNLSQTEEIFMSLKEGLPLEQVTLYAVPNISSSHMDRIRTLLKQGLTTRGLDLCTTHRFSPEQREEIISGFEYGLTLEQVTLYAEFSIDSTQMCTIRKDLISGVPIEIVRLYAKEPRDFNARRSGILFSEILKLSK